VTCSRCRHATPSHHASCFLSAVSKAHSCRVTRTAISTKDLLFQTKTAFPRTVRVSDALTLFCPCAQLLHNPSASHVRFSTPHMCFVPRTGRLMPDFVSRRHFGCGGLHRAWLEADGGRAACSTAAGAASPRTESRRTGRGSRVERARLGLWVSGKPALGLSPASIRATPTHSFISSRIP
jgi:hypothetical protein